MTPAQSSVSIIYRTTWRKNTRDVEVRFSTLTQLVAYFKSHPPRGHAVGYGHAPGRTSLPSDRAGELILAWTDASGSNTRTFGDVHQLADFLKGEPAIAAFVGYREKQKR